MFRLAYTELDTYLMADDSEKSKLNAILADLTYARFKEMQGQWLKTGRMMWYAYGNLSKDQAKTIVG